MRPYLIPCIIEAFLNISDEKYTTFLYSIVEGKCGIFGDTNDAIWNHRYVSEIPEILCKNTVEYYLLLELSDGSYVDVSIRDAVKQSNT
jgi:hypothetical protein